MSDSISSKFKEENINIKDYTTINLASFEKTAYSITDYLKDGKSPIGNKTINMKFGEQNYRFYTVNIKFALACIQYNCIRINKQEKIEREERAKRTISHRFDKFVNT